MNFFLASSVDIDLTSVVGGDNKRVTFTTQQNDDNNFYSSFSESDSDAEKEKKPEVESTQHPVDRKSRKEKVKVEILHDLIDSKLLYKFGVF